MNQEQILSILYELAMVVGAETRVNPLLNKTLQKLMYHTGFPCGMFVEASNEQVFTDDSQDGRLAVTLKAVIGNHRLTSKTGEILEIPNDFIGGHTTLYEKEANIQNICSETSHYQYLLKLPINGSSAFLLFSTSPPKNNLPLERLFEPFLRNFSKSLQLCQVNESYTERLVEEREHAYADLRRFRAALDTSDDCIFIIDPYRMKFVDFNQTAVVALQYTEKQLHNMGPHDVISELSLPQWRSIANRSINEKKEITEIVSSQKRANGETYPVEVRISVFRDKQPLLIAVSRNITMRKQAEDELKAYKDHLQDLVAERTKELEFSNKELESFSYSVAHDLRAPLRSIVGFSQLIYEDAKDKLNDKELSYLDRTISAGTQMGQLIDELLKLSQIGKTPLKTEKVDLSKLSSEIVELLQGMDSNRSIEVIVEPGLRVSADPHLLWLCMENLIGNAWKYTKNCATPKIEIGRCQSKYPDIFYVKDNGAGFNMQFKDKLFQPFQRLHNEKEFDGSGIGLATVQRIIERHGGTIWADAKVGKGAIFYFNLRDASLAEFSKIEPACAN